MKTETMISGVSLPSAPVPVHSEIRDAASLMIGAEQWLQSNGYRDAIIKMNSAKADVWLTGYRAFRACLEIERDNVRWHARVRCTAIGVFSSTVALAAGCLIGSYF